MGSSLSQPLDRLLPPPSPQAAAPAAPAALLASAAPASPAQGRVTHCWSCRVLSGAGLIGAGGYVYWVARKPLKLGYAPSPGVILQMVIGLSEDWGAATWAGAGCAGWFRG
ncbi:distal membrane-arm assembly complex protein 1 [Rhynchocyon petersi]